MKKAQSKLNVAIQNTVCSLKTLLILVVILYFPCILIAGAGLSHSDTRVNKSEVIINIRYKEAKAHDTLSLALEDFSSFTTNRSKTYSATSQYGLFNFRVPVRAEYGYFTIVRRNTGEPDFGELLIEHCFWEAGDSVTINLSHDSNKGSHLYNNCSFSGKNFQKYKIEYRADSAELHSSPKPALDTLFGLGICDSSLLILEEGKRQISPFSYQLLKADMLFPSGKSTFAIIQDYYTKNVLNGPDSVKHKFINRYNQLFQRPYTYGISENALAVSTNYLRFLFFKYKLDSYFVNGRDDPDWIYDQIKKYNYGKIRDREIILFFIAGKKSNSFKKLLDDANATIEDPECKGILDSLQHISPGQAFSNFKLKDVNGKLVQLSDLRGKVVLVDFWFYGCGGCLFLYKTSLSKVEHDLRKDPNVVFVSICGEPLRKRWLDGLKTGQYTSTDAINLSTNGLGFKHPLILENKINSFPFVVLIDRNGLIRYLNSPNLYDPVSLTKAIKYIE